MKAKTLAVWGTITALFAGAFFMFAGPAMATCSSAPDAVTCTNEVTTGLVDSLLEVISSNVLLVVGLIALSIGIPIVIRLVTSAGRKVRA